MTYCNILFILKTNLQLSNIYRLFKTSYKIKALNKHNLRMCLRFQPIALHAVVSKIEILLQDNQT